MRVRSFDQRSASSRYAASDICFSTNRFLNTCKVPSCRLLGMESDDESLTFTSAGLAALRVAKKLSTKQQDDDHERSAGHEARDSSESHVIRGEPDRLDHVRAPDDA